MKGRAWLFSAFKYVLMRPLDGRETGAKAEAEANRVARAAATLMMMVLQVMFSSVRATGRMLKGSLYYVQYGSVVPPDVQV